MFTKNSLLGLSALQSSLVLTLILYAVLLNPVLFLHGLNTVLARILPPVMTGVKASQAPPYYPTGPSAEHPHLDIHASDRLCWGYTLIMVAVQLLAFSHYVLQNEDDTEVDSVTEVPAAALAPAMPLSNVNKLTLPNPSIIGTRLLKLRTSTSAHHANVRI